MIMRTNLSRPAQRYETPRRTGIDPRYGEVLHGILSGGGGRALLRGGMEQLQIDEIFSRLSDIRQGGSSPDAAKIEAAYIGFGTMLHNKLARPDAMHSKFAMMLRTNNLIDRQLWLDNIPKMRLWEGDKVLRMLRGESLAIITKPYEASIQVPKGDLLNDRYGLYRSRIDSLGDSYLWHLEEIFIAMLIAGVQGTALGAAYDGQNLIDTDHTYLGNGTGATYSNRVNGAFNATTYQSAWNLFYSMKDENGLPFRVNGRTMYLLHGPNNRNAVRTVLNQENIVGQTGTNLDKGTAIPWCSEWITAGAQYSVGGVTVTLTGNEWFLIPEGSSAVMIQIKREPEFLAVDKGDDEFTFRTGRYLYGIESEDGAAYGLPQEIVGGPGA